MAKALFVPARTKHDHHEANYYLSLGAAKVPVAFAALLEAKKTAFLRMLPHRGLLCEQPGGLEYTLDWLLRRGMLDSLLQAGGL